MNDTSHTLLVLDIGSSSVRTSLFDGQAEPIFGASISREHSLDYSIPGAAVCDARTLRGLIETCIDDLLTHPRAKYITAVCAAAFADSLVGLDERGTPLTPVYTYADVRASSAIPDLRARLDPAAVHQRTGCVLHPSHRPAKLAWLRQTEPELFGQVQEWVDFPAYLYRAWLGDARSTFSISAWSGLLDRQHLVWDKPLLDAVGVGLDQLPLLIDFDEPLVGLRDAYRMRWSKLAEVPFYPAVGDGAAANVGAGAVGPDRVALTVGTTAALRRVLTDESSALPAGLFGYRVSSKHHLIGGATTEGGNIYAWARSVLNVPDPVEDALLVRPPDAHGLTFLPLLAGERSPGYALDATGSIVGLRMDTTPIDILQAAMEGVALRLSQIYDLLAAPEEARIFAGGGVVRASRAWTQMIADALNRPLHIIDSDEVTARGAAVLAMVALTGKSLVEAATSSYPATIRAVVEPNPEAASILHAARERMSRLYAFRL
ncbi:MAG: carbohydrate kinase [Chloroflexi bacterium]|nr:carbohydrate kinase [Chloroflexota bacterium]